VDEDQRLGADREPVQLVELLGDDYVQVAACVLEQKEDDPVRCLWALAGDDEPADCDAGAVRDSCELADRGGALLVE